MKNEIKIGDPIKDSHVGPGTMTGISDAGYPQVNHITVAWLESQDGDIFDPCRVRDKHIAARCPGGSR